MSSPIVAKTAIMRFIMIPRLRSLDSSEKTGITRARPRRKATAATVRNDPHIILITKEVNET